jgi:hypothetical protein
MATAALSLPWILVTLHSWSRILLFVGFLFLYWLFVTLKEKWAKIRTRNWPVTQGPIENIRVEKVEGGVNGADYWKLTFDYTWTVSTQHRDSYSFNLTTDRLRDAAETGLVGKVAAVHYNPKNEADACVWFDEVWDLW